MNHYFSPSRTDKYEYIGEYLTDQPKFDLGCFRTEAIISRGKYFIEGHLYTITQSQYEKLVARGVKNIIDIAKDGLTVKALCAITNLNISNQAHVEHLREMNCKRWRFYDTT